MAGLAHARGTRSEEPEHSASSHSTATGLRLTEWGNLPFGDLCITRMQAKGTPSPVEGEGTCPLPLELRKGLHREAAFIETAH